MLRSVETERPRGECILTHTGEGGGWQSWKGFRRAPPGWWTGRSEKGQQHRRVQTSSLPPRHRMQAERLATALRRNSDSAQNLGQCVQTSRFGHRKAWQNQIIQQKESAGGFWYEHRSKYFSLFIESRARDFAREKKEAGPVKNLCYKNAHSGKRRGPGGRPCSQGRKRRILTPNRPFLEDLFV